MKKSHFEIGYTQLSPLNLKPFAQKSADAPAPAEKFDINEARRKLGESSWNHG
jgi:hypothetical protein